MDLYKDSSKDPIAIPNILSQVSSQGFNLNKAVNKNNNNKPVISPSPGFKPDFHYKLQYQLMSIIPCCVSRSPPVDLVMTKLCIHQGSLFPPYYAAEVQFCQNKHVCARSWDRAPERAALGAALCCGPGLGTGRLGDPAPAQIRARGISSDRERLGNVPIPNITVS